MKKRSALDFVWFFLLALGILWGLFGGKASVITNAAMDYAQSAVELAFRLVGSMSLWLGILEIAKESGLTETLSRILSPLLRRLFPSIPNGHPALGAIAMNMAANILGIGNAATPFGLLAMKEMQSLNEEKDTASTDMILFLCLNTASITLIPGNVLALRAAFGSNNPAAIVIPVIFSSLLAAITAVLLCKILGIRRKRR